MAIDSLALNSPDTTAQPQDETPIPTETVATQDEEVETMMSITKAALDDMGLNYGTGVTGDTQTINYGMKCDVGNCNYVIRVNESDHSIVVVLQAPAHVPEDKRMIASKYLTIVNFGMKLGNFEMDFRDGEVRFKNSCNMTDGRLTKSMVQHLVVIPMMMMDRFFPGLMLVIYGGKDPQEAHDEATNGGSRGTTADSIQSLSQ